MEVNPVFNIPTKTVRPRSNGELIKMTAQSWCWFDVNITINWTSQTGRADPYTLQHTLRLENSGTRRQFSLKFDGNKISPLIN